jgi:hypothetical protein
MVGQRYRVHGEVVRVLIQGLGWPTNVLVLVIAGPRRGYEFVRPARGMRRVDRATAGR